MEKKIASLHENAFVIDAHFDLLMDVEIQRARGRKKVIETDYLPGFKTSGINLIVASIFIESEFLPEMGLRKALAQIHSLYEEIDESSHHIMMCKTYEDVRKAKQENKIGFLLSLEGIEPIDHDLRLLRIFYELGVRIVGLVWSRRNYAADGSHFTPVREGTKGGLTAFGIEVIEEAEKLGMFIDVSHLNDEGVADVLKTAKKPVIASHSNARALMPTMRNISDEQIRQIAATGGVIGINAASMLVAEDDDKSNLEHLINHLDHMVKIVGAKHVGIGLDLCDMVMKYISPNDFGKFERIPFDVIKGHESFKEITKELIKRGYDDEAIECILGNNFLRVYEEVLK
ncbi:dipeptidase [Aneurinibacillus aneurinilyticus]|uniref:dipeptidase n=1 Tax=Aneurinibacillus aneurinilyticus TaxID=1391 RepID=UPI0035268AB3